MKIENNLNINDFENKKQVQAAKEWEGYFIQTLLKEMRKTIPKSGLFGNNSFATDTYYEMLDQQIAKNMAENGGFGIAKNLFKDLFNRQIEGIRSKQIEKIYTETEKYFDSGEKMKDE